MTDKDAMKLALDALYGFIPYLPLNDKEQCNRYDKAIAALKERLADPMREVQRLGQEIEQEPVVYVKPALDTLKHSDHCRYWDDGEFCTCGAIEYEELQFWKNKALAQRTEQEPVGEVGWAANVPNTIREVHWKNGSPPIGTMLFTHPPQRTEQNFCSRCGKRTKDLITIHTCTPPKD